MTAPARPRIDDVTAVIMLATAMMASAATVLITALLTR